MTPALRSYLFILYIDSASFCLMNYHNQKMKVYFLKREKEKRKFLFYYRSLLRYFPIYYILLQKENT